MGRAKDLGTAAKVMVGDLTFSFQPTNQRRADLCVGGAFEPLEGHKILLLDIHLKVIADTGPFFSDYTLDPSDFWVVDDSGQSYDWSRDACGLPVLLPMLGLYESLDFGMEFVVPDNPGRLWLRYQPHDTKLDLSWAVPLK